MRLKSFKTDFNWFKVVSRFYYSMFLRPQLYLRPLLKHLRYFGKQFRCV